MLKVYLNAIEKQISIRLIYEIKTIIQSYVFLRKRLYSATRLNLN
jgi:hypothetical protein